MNFTSQMDNLAEKIGLANVANKTFKIFIVEMDDDDRERVVAGTAAYLETEIDYDYADVHVDRLLSSARIFQTEEKVTLTMRILKNDDGTYFRVENFGETEEDEYEAPSSWENYDA